MRKIIYRKVLPGAILFFLLLTISHFRLINVNTKAQETAIEQTKSEPVTLYIEAEYIPCEDPSSETCIPYPADIANHPDPTKLDHELGLMTDLVLPAETDIYLVGCINTDTGPRCTTGSTDLDNQLNSLPGGNQMDPDPSHEFKAMTNPIKTDANGNLGKVIVRSYTPQATGHFFYAYYLTEVEPTTAVTPFPSLVSQTRTINQGTIGYDSNTPSVEPTGLPKRTDIDMNKLLQLLKLPIKEMDPKGRFFDIRSLEPIADGQVKLLDNSKKIFNYRNLINPQKVKANGEFNFWVPNGIYFLELSEKPTGYSWPIDMTKVHPNYTLAYYCDPDVKNLENKPVPLYSEQHSIIEFNKLVHCDVPLDPGSNTPYRSEVKTVSYSAYRISGGSDIVFSGKVTHPLTMVSIFLENKPVTIAAVKANKLGSWQVKINNSQLSNADGSITPVIIKYKKIDLTQPNQEGLLSSNQLIIEPILTYVEGYAYDEKNQIIPNAKVGIRQSNSKKISYLTYADSQGYFKIPSRYLPNFPYEIIFVKPDTLVTVVNTTSVFTQKNSRYLKEKGLNLATAIRAGALSTGTGKDSKDFSLNENAGSTNVKTQSKNLTENKSFRLILILLSLLVFLLLIVVVIFFYRRKSQSTLDTLK